MLRKVFTFLIFAIVFSLVFWSSSRQKPHNANAESRPAPVLTVKSLNSSNQDLKLSDLSGKFVLVDFWATWCAPCREEVPYLQKTYERFGNDKRFAMLSISLDRGPSAPREYAASHGMNWPQGFAGTSSQSEDLTTRWGVNAIPAIFLINPDGKIIASDLRGDEIAEAISTAMHTAP